MKVTTGIILHLFDLDQLLALPREEIIRLRSIVMFSLFLIDYLYIWIALRAAIFCLRTKISVHVNSLVLINLALFMRGCIDNGREVSTANRVIGYMTMAQLDFNRSLEINTLLKEGIPELTAKRSVPLKDIRVHLLLHIADAVPVRKSYGTGSSTWWALRFTTDHCSLETLLKSINDLLIWRLLVESHAEDFLE